jgi:hypothetical protein
MTDSPSTEFTGEGTLRLLAEIASLAVLRSLISFLHDTHDRQIRVHTLERATTDSTEAQTYVPIEASLLFRSPRFFLRSVSVLERGKRAPSACSTILAKCWYRYTYIFEYMCDREISRSYDSDLSRVPLDLTFLNALIRKTLSLYRNTLGVGLYLQIQAQPSLLE